MPSSGAEERSDMLAQVQLGTGLTTILDCPEAPPTVVYDIDTVWVANVDAAGHAVSLRLGTGTLTDANALGGGWAMLANETFIIASSGSTIIRLRNGRKFQGLADTANKVTVTVFGVKKTTF